MKLKPRLSVRVRLTITYGVLFLAAGVALLAVSYVLVDDALERRPDAQRIADREAFLAAAGLDRSDLVTPGRTALLEALDMTEQELEQALGTSVEELAGTLRTPFLGNEAIEVAIDDLGAQAREDTLDELLVQGSLALAGITVLAFGAGWVVAGRVLRPLRDITAAAQAAADHHLDQRIGLTGPHDEIRDLADTLDYMLARLDEAFRAHRRFAADASHELRTPLAGMRAQADVVLAAGDAAADARSVAETVVAGSERSDRLIDGLLTLARSDAELHDVMPVDLAELVGDVVDGRLEAASAASITIDIELGDALVDGDPLLLERLFDNLVANAIAHNHVGGAVSIEVGSDPAPHVVISNTGRSLDAGELSEIQRPFGRGPARTGTGDGLGLPIVRAVARAHQASLSIEPRSEGGLVVGLRFVESSG